MCRFHGAPRGLEKPFALFFILFSKRRRRHIVRKRRYSDKEPIFLAQCFYASIIGQCGELDCARLDCGPFDLGAVPLPWLRFKTSRLLGRKIIIIKKKKSRWLCVISPASGKLKVGINIEKVIKGRRKRNAHCRC